MSITSLLHKTVTAARASNSTAAFMKDINPRFIVDTEQPLYDFVVSHIRQHGQIPSESTLIAAQFPVAPSTEPISYYVHRMRERYIYNVVNRLHPDLQNGMRTRNTDECVRVIRLMLADIGVAGNVDTYSTLINEAESVYEEYAARKFRTDLAGLTTGWPTLDKTTLGMMGGDVIVMAGRPSIGKSWLASEMAYSAWKSGASIGIVSMEMGKVQIARRWIGRHLGINPNFIRAGQLSVWAERSLKGYGHTALGMPGVSIVSGAMKRTVESLTPFMQETLPDLLYIDAAYLLSLEARKRGGISKWETIGEVIHGIKMLALATNRPVLITVQLNRNQRTNSKQRKEVDMADIGGSDSIPQDADIVLAAQKGMAPYEEIRRAITQLKNREGEIKNFETTRSFTPPCMSEVMPDDGDTAAISDWML